MFLLKTQTKYGYLSVKINNRFGVKTIIDHLGCLHRSMDREENINYMDHSWLASLPKWCLKETIKDHDCLRVKT